MADSPEAEILIVAGGAGGSGCPSSGQAGGGGGGAGGVLFNSSTARTQAGTAVPMPSSPVPVTIGAGG